MRIFCTGDVHADFKRLKKIKKRCIELNTTKDDALIILGDLSCNYWLDERDRQVKDFISTIPITFLVIRGNHEARPSNISSYQYCISKKYGALWYEYDYPSIYFLDDGAHIINGKRFLVASGAYSVDKNYRLMTGAKWFSDEQPSEEDKSRVRAVVCLNNKFDYVCSHTAPIEHEPTHLFLPFVDQSTIDKSTERYLQEIYELLDKEYLKEWLFGHYHSDEILPDKFHILYHDIVMIYSN